MTSQSAFNATTPLGRLAFAGWCQEHGARDAGLDSVSLSRAESLVPTPHGTDALASLSWSGDSEPVVTGLKLNVAQDLSFDLTASSGPARLVFQPLDRPGVIVLHEIRILADQESTIWSWQGDSGAIELDQIVALKPGGDPEPGVVMVQLSARGGALLPSLEIPAGSRFVCRLEPLDWERGLGLLLARQERLAQRLDAVLESSSWRATRPLRAVKRLLGGAA